MILLNRGMFSSSRTTRAAIIDYLIHTGKEPYFESFENDMDKIDAGNLTWSLFPHKTTWIYRDRNTENHIDHITISKKFRRSMLT